jgi:hypothetical protein
MAVQMMATAPRGCTMSDPGLCLLFKVRLSIRAMSHLVGAIDPYRHDPLRTHSHKGKAAHA